MSTRDLFRQAIAYLLVTSLVASSCGMALGQQAGLNAATSQAEDPWPREVACKGAAVKVYQPQLNSWTGNTLDAYAAVGVKAGVQAIRHTA